MLKAYKYRLYPTKEQIDMFNEHFGAARFAYNKGLETKIHFYQTESKTLSFFDLGKMIKDWREENPWLKGVSQQSIESALKNLDSAYTKFFREKKGFPKFKSKHNPQQSFQCRKNSKVDWENSRLTITKIPNIKTKFHRKFEGTVKTVTVSKSGSGKYYASILVDDGKALPEKAPLEFEKSMGIDVNLGKIVVASNGVSFENPKFLAKSEQRLCREQRRFSKMQKGSNNRAKQRLKLSRLHERVANQRQYFLHQITRILVDDSQATTYCVEDLSVKNMQKNHRLAKSISDASWGTFFIYLQYKCEWAGKNFLRIGRYEPSSKMCSVCGWIYKDQKLSDRVWTCGSCGTKHNRDKNAAKNIREMAFQERNIGLCKPESTPVDTATAMWKKQEQPLKMIDTSLAVTTGQTGG